MNPLGISPESKAAMVGLVNAMAAGPSAEATAEVAGTVGSLAAAPGSVGWLFYPPKDNGFYWVRAHGGTSVLGYWNADQGYLQLCGNLTKIWSEKWDPREHTLSDQGVEFWSEKLTPPNNQASRRSP